MGFIGVLIFMGIMFAVSTFVIGVLLIAILVATMSISFGTAISLLVKDKQIKKMSLLLALNTFLISSTFVIPLIIVKVGGKSTFAGTYPLLVNGVAVGISFYAFSYLKKINHKGLRIGGFILFSLTLGFALFILLGIVVLALLLS